MSEGKNKVSLSWKQQVRPVTAHWGRTLTTSAWWFQYGHFVSVQISPIILRFGDWIAYPSGDHRFTASEGAVYAFTLSDHGRSGFIALSRFILEFNLLSFQDGWQFPRQHRGTVIALAHRSGILVSGSTDSAIGVWDAGNHRLIRMLKGHSGTVNAVQFTAKGDHIISSSDDSTLRMWSIENGECVLIFVGHMDWVGCFTQIRDCIVSVSDDGSIKVWRGKDARCVRTKELPGPEKAVLDLSSNFDGSLIACCGTSSIFLFRWPNFKLVWTLRRAACIVEFHPSNPDWVAIADSEVFILDIRTQKAIWKAKLAGMEQLIDVRFTPDGTRLLMLLDSHSDNFQMSDLGHLLDPA